jgi:hypothetical protein
VNGYPVSRYASKIPPRKIEADVMMFLEQRDARLEETVDTTDQEATGQEFDL